MKIEKPIFADKNLEQAVTIANEMLNGKRDLFSEVRKIQAFDMSMNPVTKKPFSGSEIVELISQKVEVTVQKYRPFVFWSRAMAKTTPGVPLIRLNLYKLDRTVPSLVNTLVHECVHIVDKNLNFAHGSQYADGKDDTAPYKIGEIAEQLAGK